MTTERTLLTIDDEAGLRHGIRDYFEDSGFRVFEAENGKIGIEVFREKRPDVVLVDLRMPEVDGLEVVRTIHGESPETPLVIVSGTGLLDDAIEAMREGAWDYVTKPIADMKALEHVVDRVLERSVLLEENRKYQEKLEELVATRTRELQTANQGLALTNTRLHSIVEKVKEREKAFKTLAKGIASTGDQEVEVALIKACAAIFNTESAMVGRLDNKGGIETSALMINHRIVPNILIVSEGTPCGEVLSTGISTYPKDVRQTFPDAKFLDEYDVEGYVGAPLKNSSGEHVGVLCVFSSQAMRLPDHAQEVLEIIAAKAVSVMEQQLAEQKQEQLVENLRQAQKMEAIGTLAGGIAHDFNNILSAILGFSEIALEDVEPDSRAQRDIQEILRAGCRARDLVRHILTFSRRSGLERVPLEVCPIIKEAIKLLRASIPATIEIQQSFDTSSGLILADPTQIHQVLMNLCTNAAHAMEEKGGVLEVRLALQVLTAEDLEEEPGLSPGPYLRLMIRDTGGGIPQENLDRIFEPYFTTKETDKGSGMGLAVVHGIVKSHQGLIRVESTVGIGTAIEIFFPKVEMETRDQSSETVSAAAGTERVLVVDDEVNVVLVTCRRLERLGYAVESTTDSSEALEIFRKRPNDFDLVITDQTMPRMTGEQLAKELLTIRPDIPIILCTGFSALIDEDKAREVGIKGFLLKPVDKSELARMIRKVLEEK